MNLSEIPSSISPGYQNVVDRHHLRFINVKTKNKKRHCFVVYQLYVWTNMGNQSLFTKGRKNDK